SLLLRPRPPTEGPQAGPGASPGIPSPGRRRATGAQARTARRMSMDLSDVTVEIEVRVAACHDARGTTIRRTGHRQRPGRPAYPPVGAVPQGATTSVPFPSLWYGHDGHASIKPGAYHFYVPQ